MHIGLGVLGSLLAMAVLAFMVIKTGDDYDKFLEEDHPELQ